MSEQESPPSRVVVVTGAASGIGHATAAIFAEDGDTVFALDIAPTVPDGVTYLECDVSDSSSVRAAIEVAGASGRIDVLANVAGVVQFGRLATISEAELDRVLAIDLKGPFLMIQAALPHLKAAKGAVVNVSSVAGRVPQPYSAAYSAAKGGVTMLTRTLALELSTDGIRVNCICPGTVDTPMVTEVAGKLTDDLDSRLFERLLGALPGAIPPREIAAAIRYLASPDARMATGAVLALDGGMG